MDLFSSSFAIFFQNCTLSKIVLNPITIFKIPFQYKLLDFSELLYFHQNSESICVGLKDIKNTSSLYHFIKTESSGSIFYEIKVLKFRRYKRK